MLYDAITSYDRKKTLKLMKNNRENIKTESNMILERSIENRRVDMRLVK